MKEGGERDISGKKSSRQDGENLGHGTIIYSQGGFLDKGNN